ncbi:hypothetical protein NRI_0346 [Neorickettsia risticii str. Illinois]|uniref:Uncharacterized protein n=1 Tax=Neorickettsia risticii (strain Illinois) TaxID=434131 RepID=C6V4L6_NEORI|nr:hypothetical protein NRI_0346 [Neorickettsia risticii str. Illinois]
MCYEIVSVARCCFLSTSSTLFTIRFAVHFVDGFAYVSSPARVSTLPVVMPKIFGSIS